MRTETGGTWRSPGTPGAPRSWENQEGPSPDPEGARPCRHLDWGLPRSRTVGAWICPREPPLCADVCQQRRKPVQPGCHVGPAEAPPSSLSLQPFHKVRLPSPTRPVLGFAATPVHCHGPENSLPSPTQVPPWPPCAWRGPALHVLNTPASPHTTSPSAVRTLLQTCVSGALEAARADSSVRHPTSALPHAHTRTAPHRQLS